MHFRTTGLLLLGAMALPASATAQTTPAPPAITRTVVAATKLPTVTDVPLHFRAVSVTLMPGEKSGALAANGILYQISGSTEISVGGETRMLSGGEGLFIAAGKTEAKGPGSLIYEPFGLVHQWGNPGKEPFTFLAFNINPEGVAAVLPGAPAKIQ